MKVHLKEYITTLPAYKPANLLAQPGAHTVKFSSNENPLGPSPRALDALQHGLAMLHRYPDSSAAALRSALAERAQLPADAVLCTNGSDETILLLCLALLREGDEAVMANGTFISYRLRTLQAGAHPVLVPLNNATHDLPALADAITSRTRLLFVCNPNNPTGTMVSHAEMIELLARVPDDVLVVVDEAYYEYVSRPDYPDLLPELRQGRTNIILLRTFAKIYGLAGLRLGYAYAHPTLIDYLHRARPVFNVNALAQIAGLAALGDTEHVARSRAYAQQCRDFFRHELTTHGHAPLPSETNFLALDVGDDLAVTEALRTRGFTVTPLGGWGVPGYIRFSFGTMEQNQQFLAALIDVLAG